jgi:hypothetical protein
MIQISSMDCYTGKLMSRGILNKFLIGGGSNKEGGNG